MEEWGKITVACVYWRGRFRAPKYRPATYSQLWVERLRNMVRRHLPIEHDFVCLSNERFRLEGVRVIPLKYDLPGWWSKMELFRPDLPIISGKVLYLDLDMVLLDDISPFIPANGGMHVVGSFVELQDDGELGVHRGYNSSVMGFTYPPTLPVWQRFQEQPGEWQRQLRGDQDFLKHCFPDLATYPNGWVRKLASFLDDDNERLLKGQLHAAADLKVLLCMPYKNHLAARRYKYIRKRWQ